MSELSTLVDKLVWVDLTLDSLDVVIHIHILAQVRFQHFILFTVCLTAYSFLRSALTLAYAILLINLVLLLLSFLSFMLNATLLTNGAFQLFRLLEFLLFE